MSIIPARDLKFRENRSGTRKPTGLKVAFDSLSRAPVGPPLYPPLYPPVGTRCSHGYRPPEPSDRGAPERHVGRNGRERDDFYDASKCSALKHSVVVRSVLFRSVTL